MRNLSLQVLRHGEIISDTPLQSLNNNIVARNNMEFRLFDSNSNKVVAPDYMDRCYDDLIVTTNREEIVIENYFSARNTHFIDIDFTPNEQNTPDNDQFQTIDLSSLISIILGTANNILNCDDPNNLIKQAPTDIDLDNMVVSENEEGAIVGKLTTTDADSKEFTYTISDSRFEVVDNQLKLKDGVKLDFETEPNICVTITSTDETGLLICEDFVINVKDVVEAGEGAAPTDITLSQDSRRGSSTNRYHFKSRYRR